MRLLSLRDTRTSSGFDPVAPGAVYIKGSEPAIGPVNHPREQKPAARIERRAARSARSAFRTS
jgi:hypothetical protein